jgi:hypothetical protein
MSGTRVPASARLTVRFLRRWQVYFAGDVATFPARMAAGLVNKGIAERIDWVPAGDGGEMVIPPGAVPGVRPPGDPPRRRGGDIEEDDFVL